MGQKLTLKNLFSFRKSWIPSVKYLTQSEIEYNVAGYCELFISWKRYYGSENIYTYNGIMAHLTCMTPNQLNAPTAYSQQEFASSLAEITEKLAQPFTESEISMHCIDRSIRKSRSIRDRSIRKFCHINLLKFFSKIKAQNLTVET